MNELIYDEVTLNRKPATRDDILDVERHEAGSVPDLDWALTNLIIDGNRVGVHLISTTTPAKPFASLEPTCTSFEAKECAVYQMIDGRFMHMAAIHDAEEVLGQLRCWSATRCFPSIPTCVT
jgi:predicted ester cyclase